MKKKILFTALVIAILVSVFTIVASAKSYICVDEETEEEIFRYEIASGDYPITSYSGTGFAKYDSDGDALTWYRSATETLDSGEIKYTVTSLKTKDAVKDDGDGVLTASEITNYNNLMSITFDENSGITEFGTNSSGSGLFHKTSNQGIFLFANIPDSVTKLSNNCFRNCISLISIGISENSKLTDMGAASFFGATSLRSIYIPKGVTRLKTEFISDKYWENGLFRNCQKLETITFGENSQLEVVEKGAFNYCNSLKTITLPNSVKTIQPRAFAHCPALEYVNFGGGLERIVRIEGDADEYVSLFQYSKKLKTVVLPATFKAENLADDLHTTFLIEGITVYYAGTQEEFIKLQEKFAIATLGSGNKGITNASYNYISPCEAFLNGVHNEKTVIEYTNYSTVGTRFDGCINEGCNLYTKTEAPILFKNLGYSAAEYGDGGMTIGFLVNSEAIAEYEAVTGKTVNYGVFAVTANNIGNNDIFDENGEAIKGVIAADITNSDFDIFNLRIVGFTNEQKEIDLAMGAFVGTTKDGVSEYAYLQIGAPNDGAKYFFASYNDVLALLPADEDEVVQ